MPPRGEAFNKFSFDFPEPSVAFGGFEFGFLVFSYENAYSLDAAALTATGDENQLTLRCTRLAWAGGQEHVEGELVAVLRRVEGGQVEWNITVSMGQPIKSVSTVIRGIPRGRISTGGGPFDPRDNEILFGYPFGAGDLFGGNTARGLGTPLAMVQAQQGVYFISSRDTQVRAKRFYFQPGESGYRVEAVHEFGGWERSNRVTVPAWRAGRAESIEAATNDHYAHLERAYRLVPFEARTDTPPWVANVGLVHAVHLMHYTGYIFNDYAKTLDILRWSAERYPANQTLVFLAAWDGRYYWDYPNYTTSERLGGDAGFARLVSEGRRLGFHIMPMFGMNAVNRHQPVYRRLADAETARIDGNNFSLDWVDWDNDRHQEGWLAYMNLGVDSWRRHLTARIAGCIDRYGVDGYFLDISGGWVNNTKADMHEGTRQLVMDLRQRYPGVLACGEFTYDALYELFPMFHVYSSRGAKYSKFFSHLSHPAPGRGSSGVHESGFGRFNAETLALADGTIPTITVVDDTFSAQRETMEAIVRRARERAGL